ncbi:hypothetical protein ABT57_11320 [Photobacterium ganghwense]|uniref:Uncharacterized protein n=1 Tax=Photobacterium ganghwense TaxID=320778 RepID=A0A0J1HCN4_9GAMM|nr:hypothetical protein ABT57_11320 [Photobacterium ganghwense]
MPFVVPMNSGCKSFRHLTDRPERVARYGLLLEEPLERSVKSDAEGANLMQTLLKVKLSGKRTEEIRSAAQSRFFALFCHLTEGKNCCSLSLPLMFKGKENESAL